MSSLAAFQEAFAQTLLGAETSAHKSALSSLKDSPVFAKQIEIYRNQVLENTHDILKQMFPIVQKLLSPGEFQAACEAYFFASPPQSVDPIVIGERFPSFIENFTTEADLPHLADTATLDYGCFQSWQAMDAAAVNTRIFTDLTPEQLAARKIQLHPACFWMSSHFAIYDIWNRFNSSLPSKISNHLVPQEVVIIRPSLTVEVHKVDPGFVKTLDALDGGETLNQALLQGSLADPRFNAVAAIQFLIQNNLIISLY